MKHCPKCNQSKSSSNFYRRRTGLRQGELYEKCKDCMKHRGREYYHQNRFKQLLLAKIRRNRARKMKKQFLVRIKNQPCSDCGKKYPPYVMDFDHINKNDKIQSIARTVTANWCLKKIKEEINKCELVCANCHRIRTHYREPR